VTSENWGANSLALQLSGIAGQSYDLEAYGSAKIASVDGAELLENAAGRRLRVKFPAGAEGKYVKKTVNIQFAPVSAKDVTQSAPRAAEYAEAVLAAD
jgi:hypothetical protein